MAEYSELSFRKPYTLLAQTPMIHFQPHAHGATLRASEVKPKLDRYLLKQYGKEVPAGWKIPEQPNALNYKMRITAVGEDKRCGLTIKDCKSYFGNMGQAEPKDLVFRDCLLEIICFIPELLAFLDANIGSFFVLHNFGTRQSKGFGGFLVKEKTSEAKAEQTIRKSCRHYFSAAFPYGTDLRGRLNHAMVVYACMKNGIAMGDRKFDGYATTAYMLEGVGNDKEFIRDYLMKKKRPAYDSYEFIRAVLGLAENYDYRQNGLVKVIQYEDTIIENEHPRVPMVSLEKTLGIKRFHSPILIKIFNNKMFFLLQEDYDLILGKVFILMKDRDWKPIQAMISRKQFKDAQQAIFNSAKAIATPESFDAAFFMNEFVDYFNEEKYKLRRCPRDWKPSAELTLEKGGQG